MKRARVSADEKRVRAVEYLMEQVSQLRAFPGKRFLGLFSNTSSAYGISMADYHLHIENTL